MPAFRSLADLEVKGRVVLVRVDLNVPLKDGKVKDATRIVRVAPTLKALADKGAKVVVLSHFGRPDGEVVPEMSLAPLVGPLGEAIGRKVSFAGDCVGPAATTAVETLRPGDVVLLENTRFHAEEEENDPAFARRLAELGELYVNDAFSCAHRAHASTEGIARLLPGAAGLNMAAELSALGRALEHPERPVMAIVGGAKVSTKLELLGNLIAKVDKLVIGGGMANTFLHAQGKDVGKSLCEKDLAATAREILAKAQGRSCEIILPEDAVIADKLAVDVESKTVAIGAIPAGSMILDIGPASAARVETSLAGCKTLVWNGPVGAFETKPFDAGTARIAKAAAAQCKAGKLVAVAGGGDTVAALAQAKVTGDFTYVSTAGGAFLEWLEGKTLPGVAALAK
ncbi:MAG: phosphoglycerate kinase [Alphaproteobacteria bacterium]|nr:phosphoglycerate kinase [Alphaproteobacteria bacterium]